MMSCIANCSTTYLHPVPFEGAVAEALLWQDNETDFHGGESGLVAREASGHLFWQNNQTDFHDTKSGGDNEEDILTHALLTVASSCLVGVAGLLPALVIDKNSLLATDDDTTVGSVDSVIKCPKLRFMLSFACGGLLADVFLHLLPEAYSFQPSMAHGDFHSDTLGLMVLSGFLIFVLIEMGCSSSTDASSNQDDEYELDKVREEHRLESTKSKEQSFEHDSVIERNLKIFDGTKEMINPPHPSTLIHSDNKSSLCSSSVQNGSQIHSENRNSNVSITGYLNLIANCFDNFLHGISIGSAFLVNTHTGIITTLFILLHEIPHEMGDFAILLKSGFTVHDSLKAQLFTASIGVLGSSCVLISSYFDAGAGGGGHSTYFPFLLAFTSGGFLQISLVGVLPDLMRSDTALDFFLCISGILIGIFVMMALS